MTGSVAEGLTKSTIDRTTPASAPLILSDAELGGFACKIHPTGKRSFVVQYRRPGSRHLYQITLGPYGALTVAAARSEARRVLAEVRLGRDPFERLRGPQGSHALTVKELVSR